MEGTTRCFTECFTRRSTRSGDPGPPGGRVEVETKMECMERCDIYPGDKVTIELSPYDLTRGRITWRSKS